jgi:hypothetical protein
MVAATRLVQSRNECCPNNNNGSLKRQNECVRVYECGLERGAVMTCILSGIVDKLLIKIERVAGLVSHL